MVKAAEKEACWMREFLRFSEHQGMLLSVIEPKCIVLPLIQAHYTERFPEETFLIYDKAHAMALFYRPYQAVIGDIDALTLPGADAIEQEFCALWRQYYDSIGISQRYNPQCRRNHMPKRFWKNMTEMVPALLDAGEASEPFPSQKTPRKLN
jgi:probable DNA metabolism protein